MSAHQWRHAANADHIETSATEMLAVLRCAASLADREGMVHTAQRLRNDADDLERRLQFGDVIVTVKP